MATYGDFPGVRVETESGGVSSVSIGAEEKLVIFGESSYNSSYEVEGDDATLDVNASEPEQINATRVADKKFGSDSELADAMKEALANGANIDYLYGVAVPRERVSGETFSGTSGSTGTLSNTEIVEDTGELELSPSGADDSFTVEFRYDGAPQTPTDDDTIYLNPLTGEYAVTSGTVSTSATDIDYTYNDYSTAFSASGPRNVIDEDETGIWLALSDADNVSASLNTEVSNMRSNYQLVNALTLAEPNDNEVLDDPTLRGGADARYDPENYDTANQSVVEEYFYKFAPARQEDESATIGGGLGGLFAGNPIDDPIYNETISGYQGLEQQFTKTHADDMRAEDVIPVRSGGAIRVKGNRSTAYSESDTVAATFWTRRITDRVILIGKLIGDRIIGRINDEDTREYAERAIGRELGQLARNRLIRPNTGDEDNWSVEVYEEPGDNDEVNIDIVFSPYGIVKDVDETITVDTS